MDKNPNQGSSKTLSRLMLQKPELSAGAMSQLGYLGKLALQEHFVRWGWSIEGE